MSSVCGHGRVWGGVASVAMATCGIGSLPFCFSVESVNGEQQTESG